MSDTKTLSSNSNKRRIHEIDGRIEFFSHEIQNLDDFVSKSELECSLMTVKLKREKLKALTAVAKSRVLLADMEVLIAESDLLIDLERLKNCKRIKLDCGAGTPQPSATQDKSESTKKSVAVQTTKSSLEKKKSKRSTSAKSPVDISSDETVVIPFLTENTSNTDTLLSNFNIDLIKKSSANNSDSEASLSSSIKAEFDKPYTKTDAEQPEKKTKHKSDKKNSSKIKNKTTQPTQSPSSSKTRTVAELKAKTVEQINRSIPSITSNNTDLGTSRHHGNDRNPIPSTSTFAPIRHSMPQVVTQTQSVYSRPTTTVNPLKVPNPVTQANVMYYKDPRTGLYCQNLAFYGNKQ